MFGFIYKNYYLNKEKFNGKDIDCLTLGWSEINNYLFIGGSDGYCKINKFTNKDENNSLEENFYLKGSHEGNIVICEWNDNYQKLTTCDDLGKMIVWMYNGETFLEEMINESGKKKIISIKWSDDGKRWAIIIQGGNVIIGTVEGERLWSKDFKLNISCFSWSPCSSKILIGTEEGELKVYDSNGNYLYCFNFIDLFEEKNDNSEIYNLNEKIIIIEWKSFSKLNTIKSLLIISEKNKIFIYDGLSEEIPNYYEEKMNILCAKWCKTGDLISIGGIENDYGIVKIFNKNLNIIKTFNILEGYAVKTLTWDYKGFNLSVGIANMFYLIKIKQNIKLCYLKQFDTLVFGFNKENEDITALFFYNLKTNKPRYKFIKRLVEVKSYDDICLIIKYKNNTNNIWEINLLNYNGNIIETKEINIEPHYVEINKTNIIIANSFGYIYIWQYRTINKININYEKKNFGKETAFFIDEKPDSNYIYSIKTFTDINKVTTNLISSIGINNNSIFIGLSNNIMKVFNLTNLNFIEEINLISKPNKFHYNKSLNLLAIEDYDFNIKFFDLNNNEYLDFQLKNSWNFKWGDKDSLCCFLEKNELKIMENFNSETITKTNSYIFDFNQIDIKLFDFELGLENIEILTESPENYIFKHKTSNVNEILKLFDNPNYDSNIIFEKAKNITDKKIFEIVAENFILKEDFDNTIRAFQENENYPAIKFIENIKNIDNETLRKSEILLFLGKYEEAENLLISTERKDLAIKMWSKIGNHKKTINLIEEFYEDEEILAKEFEKLGDDYLAQLNYKDALECYKKTKNLEKIIDTAFIAEDYNELSNLLKSINEKSFLIKLAEKLEISGLIELAARAYEQGGNYKKGLDICILNNYWGSGVEIAQRNNHGQIDNLVNKYAMDLKNNNKILEAVELFRKANKNTEAAKLLNDIGIELVNKGLNPILIKKVFILSGLEVNIFNRSLLNPNMTGMTFSNATRTIDTLITSDINSSSDKILSNPWRGAEAWHFFILAQNQFSQGKYINSLKTCFRLQDYELELGIKQIYSIFTLASYYSGFYKDCSKALIKLENCKNLNKEEKFLMEELSLKIFSINNPVNPETQTLECPSKNCDNVVNEFDINCQKCGSNYGVCIASGQSIFEKDYYKCKTCKHKSLLPEINKKNLKNCSLCHSVLKLN